MVQQNIDVKRLVIRLAEGLSLSGLSCNREEFDRALPEYTDATRKNGYREELEYSKPPKKKRNRKGNVVWFNPPFSESVKNNIGRQFLCLIDKHFSKHHRLHKICNRNTVKISYNCMPNMASIISRHNKKLLNGGGNTPSDLPACNCRNKTNCPLNGGCREQAVIYKASIDSGSRTKYYIGCTGAEFKSWCYGHCNLFKNCERRNATELSKAVWKAKDSNINPTIKWSIVDRAPAYQPRSRNCSLRLSEKLAILYVDPSTALNSRSEITAKWRHKNKYKLKNIKPVGSTLFDLLP